MVIVPSPGTTLSIHSGAFVELSYPRILLSALGSARNEVASTPD